MTDETQLILPPGCLVVFADDTGHEALVPGHPVYGLGGCAVMEHDLECVIRQPWREVRRAVTGSPDTPLHASTFSQRASRRDIEAVAEFFRRQPFARLGAINSISTTLLQELGPVPTIAKTLQNRVVEIARWTRFSDLKIIFESSDRADPLIKEAFQDFGLEEDGRPIPVDCYFMPKSAGDPALEVADFIMHAASSRTLCMRLPQGSARLHAASVSAALAASGDRSCTSGLRPRCAMCRRLWSGEVGSAFWRDTQHATWPER
jgi:hypothetical protein